MSGNVYYKAAYKCNRRWMDRVHLKTLDIKRCANPEVSVRVLDPVVWEMIEEIVLKPAKLKRHLSDWESEVRSTQTKMEKELRKLDQAEQNLRIQRGETLDQYATSHLSQEIYLEKCLAYDIEANGLKLKRAEVTKKIPILHKKEVIDANIRFFCESAQIRFDKCKTFDSKRRLVLDLVEEVLYSHGKVTLKGSIPLQLKTETNSSSEEQTKISFLIEREISKVERLHLRIQRTNQSQYK